MSTRINTTSRDGKNKGVITVETLSDGTIGIGFARDGYPASAIRMPRDIARLLSEAIAAELRGDA